MAAHLSHGTDLLVYRLRCLSGQCSPGGGHQPWDLSQDHMGPQSWALTSAVRTLYTN